MKNNNKNKKKNNKKKRAPDPPGYLRPNSFVPRAPKGTHAGEGSLASEKVSLPICSRYASSCRHSVNVTVSYGRLTSVMLNHPQLVQTNRPV